MPKDEVWYQAQNEMMLELILQRYEEEYDLSESRLYTFRQQEDVATYKIELAHYKEIERKISAVKELLCYEKGTRSNKPTMISINRDTAHQLDIISSIVE